MRLKRKWNVERRVPTPSPSPPPPPSLAPSRNEKGGTSEKMATIVVMLNFKMLKETLEGVHTKRKKYGRENWLVDT
ncbi:unnamed protein product [Rodentolepis nana]|uniref:Ovule protein n=1 Tax=Rodentolepis nana TaxID=102285 RepID=A0A0R3TJ43_RODNA|nr:unnamed protein product [Rodentolepis nana]